MRYEGRGDDDVDRGSFLFVFPSQNVAARALETGTLLGNSIMFHETTAERVLREMSRRGIDLTGCHIYEVGQSWSIHRVEWQLGEPGS